jgi:hypothetical protein
VKTTEDRAVAAGDSADPAWWQVVFEDALGRIADRFVRREPRMAARAFVAGLLSQTERKTHRRSPAP